MIPFVRRQIILDYCTNRDIVYIRDLAEELKGVSESTIRRDLKHIANEGLVKLLHGGAVTLADEESSSYDMPVEKKRHLHTDEKSRIAARAASLVHDGEVIYLDSGTTTFRMVEYLKEKEIKVVTSNTHVLTELKDARFQCVILGGDVTETLGSVTGPLTDNLLREMYFDRAFLGATGYSEVSGFTTPDFREANKKQIVAANSQEVYLLVDGSKAGRRALCSFLDLSSPTAIISDEETEILRQLDNSIIVANE